jgi:hypothetical protein
MRKAQLYAALVCAVLFMLVPVLVARYRYPSPGKPQMDRCFPRGSVYHFHAEYYSKFLRAAGEDPLRPGKSGEIYRVTSLPSFEPAIIVHVESRDRGADLVRTEVSVRFGAEPGAVSRSKSVRITQRQWESLLSALDQAEFWKLDAEDGRLGCDGYNLVFEGMRHGRYHVVSRWTPEAGPFLSACLRLFELSRVGGDSIAANPVAARLADANPEQTWRPAAVTQFVTDGDASIR